MRVNIALTFSRWQDTTSNISIIIPSVGRVNSQLLANMNATTTLEGNNMLVLCLDCLLPPSGQKINWCSFNVLFSLRWVTDELVNNITGCSLPPDCVCKYRLYLTIEFDQNYCKEKKIIGSLCAAKILQSSYWGKHNQSNVSCSTF